MNQILAQVENMVYPVTVDALHTVFSPYGFVQKIAIFEKSGQHQVRILSYSFPFQTPCNPMSLPLPVKQELFNSCLTSPSIKLK